MTVFGVFVTALSAPLAAYVAPQSGVPVARILRRVLAHRGISQKTAAIEMGGPAYEATLSRGLAGLGPIDLCAVMKLDDHTLYKLFRLLHHAKRAVSEQELFHEERKRA